MTELEKKAYAYATDRQKDPNYPVYNLETEITDAYKQGWQDAIDKACEWLKFNYIEFTDNSRLGLNINELIKDFKKDMEEQQ